LALLPPGQRAEELMARAERAFSGLGVCLPLTEACAPAYAEVVAERTRMGRPIGGMDALIAAVARVAGATIATRDVAGFDGLGIELIDPWTTH